jgi:hypothetical protein
MGCDIHAHMEVKIDGVWHHWYAPDIRRSYALFARLAGVRTKDPSDQHYPTRGLPDDASVLTKIDYKRREADWHTPSWICGEEMDTIEEWMIREGIVEPWIAPFGYLFGNRYSVEKYPGNYPPGVESARMVFWFDS